MDFQILANQFYDHSNYIRNCSPNTISKYKRVLSYFQRYARIRSLEEVSAKNVKELFLHGRSEKKWQSRTFILTYHVLTVFFRWCRLNGHMDADPLEGIELPRVEKKLPEQLTQQEAMRLLDIVANYPYDYPFLRYRNHAIFATYIMAGLRKSELLNLKMTDVDIENLTIFVRQGKGFKDRMIPLSYALAQILAKYLCERKRLKKTCPQFFTSLNRNMGFTVTGLRNLLAKMRKASNIKFSALKFRHTFATLMIEGGCDLVALSRMMGHSDVKTTLIYVYVSAKHLRLEANKHPLNNVVRTA